MADDLAPTLSNSSSMIDSSCPVDSTNSEIFKAKSQSITPRQFVGMLSKSVRLFVAKMYANLSVPRSLV